MAKTKRVSFIDLCVPVCITIHGVLKVTINSLIKLTKEKALRKHSLHVKTAASVLLKLLISGNERCYTNDAPL